MEKKIIMKTNVNKTSTGIKVVAPPKGAKAGDRILAGFIDFGFLFILVQLTNHFFDLSSLLSTDFMIPTQGLIFSYYYFVLIIVPHSIFSQTLGKMLMKLKVVSQTKHQRLSLSKVIIRDIFMRPLAIVMPLTLKNRNGVAVHDRICGSVVVEAR